MKPSAPLAAVAPAVSSLALAQGIPDVRTAGAVLLLSEEPPAKITVDPPLAAPLARGRVAIPYRVRNIRLLPEFGPAAAAVSPRIGHLHVARDGAGWYWKDARGGPIIINGLAPGQHILAITLVNGDHQQIDRGVISFLIPAAAPHH